jgi:hypothetical protein
MRLEQDKINAVRRDTPEPIRLGSSCKSSQEQAADIEPRILSASAVRSVKFNIKEIILWLRTTG